MKTFLTNAGRSMSAGTFVGDAMTFTKVQFGNGEWQALNEEALRDEIRTATELKHMILECAFDVEGQDPSVTPTASIEIDENGFVVLRASFKNNEIGDVGSFDVTEIGYFVEDPEGGDDILYALCAVDKSEADFIPNADQRVGTFSYSAYIYVGDVANVTAVLSTNSQYATAESLSAHIQNKNNPHETTKAHVGLSEVPNVWTGDQAPTFEEWPNFENIDGTPNPNDPLNVDGEPTRGKDNLSTLFAKIQKAISVLADHKENIGDSNFATRKGNPHGTTADAVGAASAKHTHNATSDITGGVLKVAYGGTGLSTGANYEVKQKHQAGTNNYGVCSGAIELPGGLLVQWGWVQVDRHDYTCEFKRSFADANYALVFPTCGDTFVPVWKNPTKSASGFTMTRTFGINSKSSNVLLTKMAKLMSLIGKVPQLDFDNILDLGGLKNTLKSFWNWLGQLKNYSNVTDSEILEVFGANQAADWIAIGRAG